MTTFIVIIVAGLGLLLLLGGVITFAYLCGMLAGGAVGWAFKVKADIDDACETDPEVRRLLSPEYQAEIDALVANSQQMARESAQREALRLRPR